MAYLFGSRATGKARVDSDVDVFVEMEERLRIPDELLIECGGPLDAFHMPDGCGWACAIGSETDRRLKIHRYMHEEVIEMPLGQVLDIAREVAKHHWPPAPRPVQKVTMPF